MLYRHITNIEHKIHFTDDTKSQIMSDNILDKDNGDLNISGVDEHVISALLQRSREAIIRISADRNIEFASPACYDIFGYTPEEIIKDTSLPLKLLHAESRKEFDNFWKAYKETGYFPEETQEWKWRNRNGDIFYTENIVSNIRDADGNVIGFITSMRDITKRKQAEESLIESEERYRLLFESSPEVVAIVGMDGFVQDVNYLSKELVGYSREDVIGKHFADIDLFNEEVLPNYLDLFIEMVKGKNLGVLEVKLNTVSGDDLWVEIYASRLMKKGAVYALQVIFRDITKRKNAEDKVRRAKNLLEEKVRERTKDLEAIRQRLERDIKQREHTEKALRESEEKYRTLVENANDAICITQDWKLAYCSRRFTEINGYTPEEMHGREFLEFFPEYEKERMSRIYERHISGAEEKMCFEAELLHKSGDIVSVELNVNLINYRGKPASLDFIRDITDRKLAIEQLKETEELQKGLVEAIPDPIFMVNQWGEYVFVNKVAARMFGTKAVDMFGKKLHDYFPAKIADKQLSSIRKVFESGVPMPAIESKSVIMGERRWFITNLTPIKDAAGATVYVLGIATDITSRKMAEELLRTSEGKYRRLIENLEQEYFFYSHDTKGVLTYLSPSLTRILGYTVEEFMSHYTTYMTDSPVNENVYKYTDLSIAGKKQPPYEIEMYHKDGSIIMLEVSEVPVFDENGTVVAVEGIAHDITARKKYEKEKEKLMQQLIQSQKMEAIGTLAGGMAHEFNNILAVVMGTAEMAIKKIGEDDPNRKRIARILRSADRARDLTTKLLTFARKEKLDVQVIAVEMLLEDLIDILERVSKRQAAIRVDYIGDMPGIKADANQMHQALLNICLNALDAMPDGGTIKIACEQVTIDNDHCRDKPFARPGAYCRISITDTGDGIPEDIMKNIFEPFFTTKERGKGTGLGLSVTLGIIRNHGGHIEVTSHVGEGTTFEIYLPIADVPAESRDSDPANSDTTGNGELIMLIDDDKDVIDMTGEALENAGFRILPCNSGRRAVEMFRKMHGVIDAVLLDFEMSEMNGRAVYRELKKVTPDVKVAVVSGYSVDAQARRMKQDGIKKFLQKPFGTRELCKTVNELIYD